MFASSDRFLRWFCTNVTQQLGLESRLNDYWEEDMGALINSTIYFQGYLLKELSHPMVLALDDIDQLFEYPEVSSDFFVLLRSWYEETKDISVWQKLRIGIAHAILEEFLQREQAAEWLQEWWERSQRRWHIASLPHPNCHIQTKQKESST
uniref:Uncharacterized protein n=1 Tax=Tolypothrix bouteillei VB521301 TaxID=1479485 RepID=A0A0C1NEF7_9CYAN|nr:AAA-like domain-containing protein [Tolypothrix bouteillei]